MHLIRRQKRKTSIAVRLAIISLLAMMMFGGSPIPASAGGKGAGVIEITGLTTDPGEGAYLPEFPDTDGGLGTFKGKANGTVEGKGDSLTPFPNGPVWSVTFKNALVTAVFAYTEPALNCPLAGTASGSGGIGAGPSGLVVGTYGTWTVVDAYAAFLFGWNRTGANAVITTAVDLQLRAGDGLVTFTRQVLLKAPDTAVATFAAHDGSDANPVTDTDGDGRIGRDELCDGGPVSADVVVTDVTLL